MGRGSLPPRRWKADRIKKKKARDKRHAGERGEARRNPAPPAPAPATETEPEPEPAATVGAEPGEGA